MATSDYLAFDKEKHPIDDLEHLSIGIVRTEWNREIVDSLEASCKETLINSGVQEDNIHLYVVPGSYELPVGAKYLANSHHKPDAVICLGCVIQGETKHDDYINHSIARAICQLSLVSNKPIILGVLTTNNIEQAKARAGGSHGDKGAESAHAALKMISLKQQLTERGKKISF